MQSADIVPIIDLSQGQQTVAEAFDQAYTQVGFCQIINHGLDAAIEEDAWSGAQAFFALSDDEKLAVAIIEGNAYGYGPFQAERLAASLGKETPPDLKETFAIGPFHRPGDLAVDESSTFVYSPNRWPLALPRLQTIMKAHYQQMAHLAERIMVALAVGLGLPQNFFEPSISEHTSALRLLHYPSIARPSSDSPAGVEPGSGVGPDGFETEPNQLRAGAHADYGTLTLLRQDNAPGGLQVLGVDERWHNVSALPGAYVVNVGDALARWTNDRWRSTIHRVALPPTQGSANTSDNERFSMAFFHNANWDAVIECIPTCLAPGQTPLYEPITAGQHLMDKFRSTQ